MLTLVKPVHIPSAADTLSAAIDQFVIAVESGIGMAAFPEYRVDEIADLRNELVFLKRRLERLG